jgi:CheY-like chemotaxis protein
MDVQMPIIDGYRATHIIRHHSPYRLSTREIPIIAMTASAIQGDREKCHEAGMDDYLAKPVKGKTLEKMIVKWAITRRSPDTPGGSDYESSECEEAMEENCSVGNVPRYGRSGMPSKKEFSHELLIPRPTVNERQNSRQLTLPGTESEADREERRSNAEERALFARDEKMVGAAGALGEGLDPDVRIGASLQMLTRENMGKLQQEQDEGTTAAVGEWSSLRRETSNASSGAESGEGLKEQDGRPARQRRWHDSERTVTDHER